MSNFGHCRALLEEPGGTWGPANLTGAACAGSMKSGA